MTFSDVFFPYNLPKSNYQSKGLQGSFTAIILAKTKVISKQFKMNLMLLSEEYLYPL